MEGAATVEGAATGTGMGTALLTSAPPGLMACGWSSEIGVPVEAGLGERKELGGKVALGVAKGAVKGVVKGGFGMGCAVVGWIGGCC